MVRNASPLQSGHIAADNAMPYHQATHRTSRERSMRAANVSARARAREIKSRDRVPRKNSKIIARERIINRGPRGGTDRRCRDRGSIAISANVEDRASSSGPDDAPPRHVKRQHVTLACSAPRAAQFRIDIYADRTTRQARFTRTDNDVILAAGIRMSGDEMRVLVARFTAKSPGHISGHRSARYSRSLATRHSTFFFISSMDIYLYQREITHHFIFFFFNCVDDATQFLALCQSSRAGDDFEARVNATHRNDTEGGGGGKALPSR